MAKRKRINSSRKGGQFERTLCKRISHWWSNGVYDDLFWRTAGSGARATTRSKQGKRTLRHYGDIGAVSDDGAQLLQVFTISLKDGYSKGSLHDVFDKPTGIAQLTEFIYEAENDAASAGSMAWMIIWKRARRRPIAWMPCITSTQLKLHKLPYVELSNLHLVCDDFRGHFLADFFEHVTPKQIKQLAKYAD